MNLAEELRRIYSENEADIVAAMEDATKSMIECMERAMKELAKKGITSETFSTAVPLHTGIDADWGAVRRHFVKNGLRVSHVVEKQSITLYWDIHNTGGAMYNIASPDNL